MKVKPRNAKVSGLLTPRFLRLTAAWRPNSITRVLTGDSENASNRSREAQIGTLDAEITQRSKTDPPARRLMTIPGVGPIVSTAITALALAAEGFAGGRDFAAWLGLTPMQKSTGGKQRLGAVSKRGERTIRRLLIIGASAVVQRASRCGAAKGSWLAQMLARKPKMLVNVALASKMARIVWALLVKGGVYRAPVAAA